MKTNSYVDWTILTWRFKINFEKITIQFFENFFDFDNKVSVYVLMCSTFNIEITSKMRKLFEFSKSYKNCFDFKNVKTFSEYKYKNYVIDLIFSAKPLYDSLYIFFKIEFDVLKNYLLKNLTLNCIRKFINYVNAFILFVFKKTIVFDFVSIIKN